MDALSKHNALRRCEITTLRDEKLAAHAARLLPDFNDYPLLRLKERIADALSRRWNKGRLQPQLEIINRERFGGDLSLKLPQLLEDRGPKEFIRTDLPWIVEILKGGAFSDAISAVRTTGMYINLVLSDRWFVESAQKVADLGPLYGMSDIQKKRTVLVEYSSPNVAKVLHAGHIRSTIIGDVLANLHDACGALVYRINHINDFGGFGFILEGYRRFRDRFPQNMSNSERLVEVYRIRRTLERLVQADKPFEMIDEDDRTVLARYFPHVVDLHTIKSEYQDFVKASDAHFAALEAGEVEEVDLWSQMVQWSLLDFEQFYSGLNIKFDLILGESFYFAAGDAVVKESLQSGAAIRYDQAAAQADLAENNAILARGEITEAEMEKRADQIRKDIGAVVIRLSSGERFIVRRTDGRSIYSTRDLGAIRLRYELFRPTDMIYVVGEEQRLYFSQLFKTAYAIGIAPRDSLRFRHIYFGFYVDARSGRKLSSRDSVANVNQLLAMSIGHFRLRTSERGDLTEEELDNAARQLAVGSIVFNDLKQDVKGPVEIDTTNLDSTIADFEKSGGAYAVYTACRARSILRKYGAELPRIEGVRDAGIDAQEASLLLKIQEMPERLARATEESNPTPFIRLLLEIATTYNSYYNRVQVLNNGTADPVRLLFTKAVTLCLINGLRVCHIECPEKI